MINSLISIIVPIYNVESYVSKCINSILCQTHSNIEIILIDDGSTDKSGVICDELAQKDSRVKVLHKDNEGLVRARKSGLKMARGEYIGFVDGDDYIDSNMYETLLRIACETDADMVHIGYERAGELCLPCNDSDIVLHEENKIDFFRKYILGFKEGTILTPSIWSKLFKVDLIKKCYSQVPDECCYGEDLICLSYSFLESKKIVLRKEALYHYVIRNDSMTNIYIIDRIDRECNLYKHFINMLNKYNIERYLEKETKEYFEYVVWILAKNFNKHSIYVQDYLYPDIEKLKGKNIVLYGAGKVGKDYYSQICRYPECNIILWVDRNWESCHFSFFEVKEISSINQYNYDFILIAIKNKDSALKIKKELIENKVEERKILWMEPQDVR